MKRRFITYANLPLITMMSIAFTMIMGPGSLQGRTLIEKDQDEIRMECWMKAPFETSVSEAELTLEPWMTEPFESSTVESYLTLESWMKTPWI